MNYRKDLSLWFPDIDRETIIAFSRCNIIGTPELGNPSFEAEQYEFNGGKQESKLLPESVDVIRWENSDKKQQTLA